MPVLPLGTPVTNATVGGRSVQLFATERGLAWGAKKAGIYSYLGHLFWHTHVTVSKEHGFPNYEETQEGLAVFAEYMSNNLTVTRLKELAYRVIAVDSLAKGYDFSKTFRLLHNQFDLEREQAFYISLRVHRGGGFTKDYLYLTGLKKIYDRHRRGENLSPLLTGKVSLEYLDVIQALTEKGFAVPSKYITDSYASNSNTDETVDFILNNLK